jgi:hypothetical protein
VPLREGRAAFTDSAPGSLSVSRDSAPEVRALAAVAAVAGDSAREVHHHRGSPCAACSAAGARSEDAEEAEQLAAAARVARRHRTGEVGLIRRDIHPAACCAARSASGSAGSCVAAGRAQVRCGPHRRTAFHRPDHRVHRASPRCQHPAVGRYELTLTALGHHNQRYPAHRQCHRGLQRYPHRAVGRCDLPRTEAARCDHQHHRRSGHRSLYRRESPCYLHQAADRCGLPVRASCRRDRDRWRACPHCGQFHPRQVHHHCGPHHRRPGRLQARCA